MFFTVVTRYIVCFVIVRVFKKNFTSFYGEWRSKGIAS